MSTSLHEIYLRLRPADIAYVKFVLESYETVGFLRTVDREAAVLVLLIVPDFLADAEGMLASIESEISLERIPRPADVGDDWLVQALATAAE
ncbi:MAG: hypothetical protein QOD06_1742 [Candidatus Binatota bacterium]|jgi:hypothetical protein|nr:hypothetical protein [Candidatus Binatota bacterium]